MLFPPPSPAGGHHLFHFITGWKYVPSKICPVEKVSHFIYWLIICPSIICLSKICPSKKRPGAFTKAHGASHPCQSLIGLLHRCSLWLEQEVTRHKDRLKIGRVRPRWSLLNSWIKSYFDLCDGIGQFWKLLAKHFLTKRPLEAAPTRTQSCV